MVQNDVKNPPARWGDLTKVRSKLVVYPHGIGDDGWVYRADGVGLGFCGPQIGWVDLYLTP